MEQLQERCERLTSENHAMKQELEALRRENTKYRLENINITRELHGYAYMLTKAELATRVAECERGMIEEEYQTLRAYIIENGIPKKQAQIAEAKTESLSAE